MIITQKTNIEPAPRGFFITEISGVQKPALPDSRCYIDKSGL